MEKALPVCPVETTLMLISDRWKVLIIRDLLEGTKRFGELKRSVGNVSQKVLTANLRSMEASGLLTRKVYAEVPPRVEYTLTETGYSLKPILDAMVAWGQNTDRKTAEKTLLSSKPFGVMIFQNISSQFSPANTIAPHGEEIPAFFSLEGEGLAI